MLKNILVNFKLLALYSLYREKNHVYMWGSANSI